MVTLTTDQGRGVAAAMRWVALSTLATCVLIGCSSPIPEERPDPDPDQLILVWDGRYESDPQCDDKTLWEGWAGTPGPVECEPCECGPSACFISSKVRLYSSSTCSSGDDVATIDAGGSWDGTCMALTHPVPSDSYAAVMVEPPIVSGCGPVSPVPPLRRTNMTFVRACSPDIDFFSTDFLHCYPPQPNGECWDS